jgi:hypothetical protein
VFIEPLLRNGLHNPVVPTVLGLDDIENTASSIVACWIVFTELLPGNALISSVNNIKLTGSRRGLGTPKPWMEGTLLILVTGTREQLIHADDGNYVTMRCNKSSLCLMKYHAVKSCRTV